MLNRYQASVLSFLFERIPLQDEVDSMEFSLAGTFSGKFQAAHCAIDLLDRTARIVFNLPNYSHSVFLALTRQDPIETARVLANLEDYQRERSLQFRLGEAVVLQDQWPGHSNAPHAALLLRASTSSDCKNVPDSHDISGTDTSFFLVVPLTAEEIKLRNLRGYDALITDFIVGDKGIFF